MTSTTFAVTTPGCFGRRLYLSFYNNQTIGYVTVLFPNGDGPPLGLEGGVMHLAGQASALVQTGPNFKDGTRAESVFNGPGNLYISTVPLPTFKGPQTDA